MIYTGLGRVGEIADVKAHGGADVVEVYGGINEANPIYYKTRTITGQTPLSYKALSKPLSDYLISGNTVQDGTPSPEAAVDVQGVGERTENLFDGVYPNIRTDVPEYRSIFVGDGEFTLSTSTDRYNTAANLFFLAGRVTSGATTSTNGVWKGSPRTITSLGGYVTIAYRYYNDEKSDPRFNTAMLNAGSTALPYEPYGYKLDISSGGRNLFDYQTMEGTIKEYYLDTYGELQPSNLAAVTDYIPCSGGSFTLDKVGGISPSICLYDKNKQFLYGKAYNTQSGSDKQTIIVDTSFNASFIRFTYFYTGAPQDDLSAIMLNSGSIPLPYEPYNRITTPIYLGQVETTRKIYKMRLVNPLSSTQASNGYRLTFNLSHPALPYQSGGGVCNIARWNDNYNQIGFVVTGKDVFITQNVSEWATKDSATRWFEENEVYIWYVLATPETGIVNESLMKISGYADTISMAQAGVAIPTVSGANVLDMTSSVKPSAVSITGNIKPTGYGQLLDVNDVDIQDSTGEPVYIQG